MSTTGLLFGSFNPVHLGHLIVAQYFVSVAGCDEVWLVVSPQNPFKSPEDLAPAQHRLQMARLAVQGNDHLKVCDIEFELPLPSYTYRTLEHLRTTYPTRNFSLLLGDDLLDEFTGWKNYGEILTHHRLLVYPRKEIPSAPPEAIGSNLTVHQAPRLEISSTAIRNLLGKDIIPRYLVPDTVLNYITREGLYRVNGN